MKIVFDNLKTDIHINDFIEIKINNTVKLYKTSKIENNRIESSGGISGYTTLQLEQI
jgi:hypothetical protein